MHTACYFNNLPAVKRLLRLGMNIDVRDYQGKSPLHRTRDIKVMKVRVHRIRFCFGISFFPLSRTLVSHGIRC